MSDVIPVSGDNGPVLEAPIQLTPTAKEELEAKRNAGLAKLNAMVAAEKTPTAAVPVPEAPPSTPPVEIAQPVVTKEEVPSQFQKPDGTLDEDKLNQSKQHLEEMKKQKLTSIEDYKKLQREVTQVSQEEAKLRKEVKAAEPARAAAPEQMPESLDALKRELLADLEKDPAEALVKTLLLGKKLALEEVDRREAERAKAQKEEAWLTKLDSHSNENPWILSEEGKAAIGEVLRTRPYLYQGSDPYGDALAFVDKSRFASGQQKAAQAASPRTPILSGNRAVPPPASAPVSDEQTLKALSQKLQSSGSMSEKFEIKARMDALVEKMIRAKAR